MTPLKKKQFKSWIFTVEPPWQSLTLLCIMIEQVIALWYHSVMNEHLMPLLPAQGSQTFHVSPINLYSANEAYFNWKWGEG